MGSGSVTVTSTTARGVAGTFEFVGVRDSLTHTVSDGVFAVTSL
jgi:hypothetical protein